jgi:enoyl-CoA hydratase
MHPDFTTLKVTLDQGVATISLNRPEKANAMNAVMWDEIKQAMEWVDATPEVRVGVLRAEGKWFTAGIDLGLLMEVGMRVQDDCTGRSREKLRRLILELQDSFTAVERCRKPVLAAVHGACIGAGVDLITACDMRYCSADTYFSVKEVDVGLTADVGTLQRLPRIVGEGMARELAYTARNVDGREAEAVRLVNRCFDTPEALYEGVHQLAVSIAAKSPLCIRGTKEMISYVRDHSTADSLNYVATWNAAMLFSADLQEAGMAMREKRVPQFKD